jgi:hypothetical protein
MQVFKNTIGHIGFPNCVDLDDFMRSHPDWHLTSIGFFETGDPILIEEVQLAAEWIRHSKGLCEHSYPICASWENQSHPQRELTWISSYALKHIVEKDMGEYVSNGAMIAAALLMKVDWKGKIDNSPKHMPNRRLRAMLVAR